MPLVWIKGWAFCVSKAQLITCKEAGESNLMRGAVKDWIDVLKRHVYIFMVMSQREPQVMKDVPVLAAPLSPKYTLLKYKYPAPDPVVLQVSIAPEATFNWMFANSTVLLDRVAFDVAMV